MFQELSILQDLDDASGECRAHGNLGAVHLSLANYINAMKCYQEQLDKAKEVKDPSLEATAYGNLGIAKMNLGRHEDAIGMYQ
jgi:tetratricopeptide (TPR) repeat protein